MQPACHIGPQGVRPSPAARRPISGLRVNGLHVFHAVSRRRAGRIGRALPSRDGQRPHSGPKVTNIVTCAPERESALGLESRDERLVDFVDLRGI
jgi:hypothetical protein